MRRARIAVFPGILLPAGVDLTEPQTAPSIIRISRWRRLPLTAQLGIVGMLVTLAWFLATRLEAERRGDEEQTRTDSIEALHHAEVATVSVLADVTAMAAAHRGQILGTTVGQTESTYEVAYRNLLANLASVRAHAPENARLRRDLDRITELILIWDREVVVPNFAVHRTVGLSAFARGTPGADRLRRGETLLTEVRARHGNVLRGIREELIRLEADAETAVAFREWEDFLIFAAAVAIFLLLLWLMMRVVSRALNQVVVAAEALDVGRYEAARLPHAHRAPNQEMARLARTFDRLSVSIATRERQLQEDIVKLKELESLKADFVSTVSHELRTPLTSMRGALGLLLGGAGGELAPKGRELLRIALTNTDRLIRLINDILDIEKMDAGHVSIRRDRLRLQPVLESTLAGLDGLSKETGVALALGEVADVEVIGDTDRLTQVFTNLISNAVKFSPKERPVEIGATIEERGVRVDVRDHGPGIPPEFASRIFGRFQQAGGADSRRSGGTGLGLSIAKAITELHGGQITFRNASDGGTIFSVLLPIAPRPTGDSDDRAAVLIVEDDDSMREVISALLEPFARPVAVPDAAAAMRTLGRQQVRVIILDHGLPGMDGLAFARRLRADSRYRALPILLYSANEFTPSDLKASGIRISDAFVKTRDPESAIIDRVKRELQGS